MLDHCCSTLQSFDVSGCFQVDDAVLIDTLTRCNQLKYLDIENCRKISDKGVDGLVSSKRKLDSINIGGDYNITNTGLKKFVTKFPNLRDLRHLHVSGLDINDDIIYSIVDNCSDLTSLSISFADISEDALNTLLDKFGNINYSIIYYLLCMACCMFLTKVLWYSHFYIYGIWQLASRKKTHFFPVRCPI